MERHPEKLNETTLWNIYLKKNPSIERQKWVEDVYKTAINWLKAVPLTFPNYTLHDETHVLNVIYAMGGILGDQIEHLSVCECEILILSAALHDIGMVYDDDGKRRTINNLKQCQVFLRKYGPEYIGLPFEKWPEDKQQGYLRAQHPFRIPELLANSQWKFNNRPREVVPKEIIVAVCQAHGEDEDFLKNCTDLKYRALPYDADPRFCALLLRLADIMDFDDTRAPEILFSFAERSSRSVEAFQKHLASGGFIYPATPTEKDLDYFAECDDPWVEYKLRDYLNWVDQELFAVDTIKKLCEKEWQRNFPFPRKVSRNQITSVGYDSDDFRLTMDQEHIMSLLTGENLYDSNDVFVRELLQNAMDATLLRAKIDPYFNAESEEAAIYLWEGIDKNGNLIFRIDDQGTGMTRGMIKRYFLKVGNSYYKSDEIIRDLREKRCNMDFCGISRFGIGFLSCFLCGLSADVSTLYYDEHKCQEEYDNGNGVRNGYGLRMEVTGLNGYYTLRNQALSHVINDSLSFPDGIDSDLIQKIEYNGYRSKAGTSIVVRLDPGKLGTIDIQAAAEKVLCGARMPVYFNGKRIGQTYSEILADAHSLEGERIYELSDEDKRRYDETFPSAVGNYPKISILTTPLDKEYPVLPGLSGVVLKYNIIFDSTPKWVVMDQTYVVSASFDIYNGKTLLLTGENVKSVDSFYWRNWERLVDMYGDDACVSLENIFQLYNECPSNTEELGESWYPFAEKEDISNVWRMYVDKKFIDNMKLQLNINYLPLLALLTKNDQCYNGICSYNAVFSGRIDETYSGRNYDALFYLEEGLRPTVDIGRSRISELPTEVALALCGIMVHLDCKDFDPRNLSSVNESFSHLRKIRNSNLGKWLERVLKSRGEKIKMQLESPLTKDSNFSISSGYYSGLAVLFCYFMAILQDDYDMTINYENAQILTIEEKQCINLYDSYDLFPPMMFCNAASEQSRKYICCKYWINRRGITADHPFTIWLLKNAITLKKQFPRQFNQIVYCLRNKDSEEIVETISNIRDQFSRLQGVRGVSLDGIPRLSESDFWDPSSLLI